MLPTSNSFVSELSKIKPNSTFLTLKGYRNAYSEISDYNIVFNISYESALNKSLLEMKKYIPTTDLEIKAKQSLIDGYEKSLLTLKSIPFEELEDHYTHFKDENGSYIKGIKFHDKTETIHLYGFVVHKKIIIPGIYPKTNKRELTIVKEKLAKRCSVSKFRQFKIVKDQLDYISVNKLTLLPA